MAKNRSPSHRVPTRVAPNLKTRFKGRLEGTVRTREREPPPPRPPFISFSVGERFRYTSAFPRQRQVPELEAAHAKSGGWWVAPPPRSTSSTEAIKASSPTSPCQHLIPHRSIVNNSSLYSHYVIYIQNVICCDDVISPPCRRRGAAHLTDLSVPKGMLHLSQLSNSNSNSFN